MSLRSLRSLAAIILGRRVSRAALLPVLCLTADCLEFEEQTVTYSYDAKTGTLRIFQDYHGIFGADQPDRLSSEEQSQLNRS